MTTIGQLQMEAKNLKNDRFALRQSNLSLREDLEMYEEEFVRYQHPL